MSIVLDYGDILTPRLGSNGIEPERLKTDLAEKFERAHAKIEKTVICNEGGFIDLESTWTDLEEVEALAQGYKERFNAVVVVGMGGSSLGVQTVCQALLGDSWNLMDDESRDCFPKVYFLDNLDPVGVFELLEAIDVRRTLFNVVSKSGSTAETLALYAVIEDLVVNEVGPDKACEHFLFTTDPSLGTLRSIAENRGIKTLEVPPKVGGRFSVLSPPSLFLAALVGLDVRRIIKGAKIAKEQCKSTILRDNKAGIIGTLLYVADLEQKRNVHVIMPYCDRLQKFCQWLQQLWSESLGKAQNLSGDLVNNGPTLLTARGAADQHSQLQLFTEGPENKVIFFLTLKDHAGDINIPVEKLEFDPFRSLSQWRLGELLNLEYQATVESLRRMGRPTMTLELDKLNEEVLGELLMLFMVATVYAAALYEVDPLNQPGVELSKRLTFELLDREEIDPSYLPKTDSRWRLGETSSD